MGSVICFKYNMRLEFLDELRGVKRSYIECIIEEGSWDFKKNI